jgi:hypothetical protein
MTADEKLTAILAAVQTDPGNRGLARDPADNLFTACPGDFAAACRIASDDRTPSIMIDTGFFIPTSIPPTFETDGPLGAVFLLRAIIAALRKPVLSINSSTNCARAIQLGATAAGIDTRYGEWTDEYVGRCGNVSVNDDAYPDDEWSLNIALEHVGPADNDRCYSMRGQDITAFTRPAYRDYEDGFGGDVFRSIGIGDGGNEIGMGKIPHETIVKNIPNGDLIHCRVPTDYLIVAGVSNWGAYALAAGVYVLRGVKPPADLFDPDREREILEVMVREGPLVDGVTGKQTATVDGLSWEEYARPLVRIREILES